MRSSKSRSRNKNRNRNTQGGGNIVNRVFDSSGPEGKVRGTPAQIIEKYGQLARDAQLSGDRVAVENFQQHSEHYTRMLAAAQKEIDARQQQNQGQGGNNQNNGQNNAQNSNHGSGGQQGQQGGGQQNNGQPNGGQQGGNGGQENDGQNPGQQNNRQGGNRRRERNDPQGGDPRDSHARDTQSAPDVIDAPEADNGLVETPETPNATPAAAKADKPKRTRTRKKAPAEGTTSPAEPASEG